jgi:rubrerythrin
MSNIEKSVIEILKRAIRGEEDGCRFYDMLSKKTDNTEAKRKLEHLRDDEVRHKHTLIEFYKKYVGEEVGELPEEGLSVLTEIFRSGKVNDLKTEMEFINLAIEAELAATKYYQEKKQLTDNSEIREIFDRLAGEEHHHYELLIAEREALSGNYYWFGYDEGAPMED